MLKGVYAKDRGEKEKNEVRDVIVIDMRWVGVSEMDAVDRVLWKFRTGMVDPK